MPTCYACHRPFKNNQSLFGHLKHCKKYVEAKAAGKAPSSFSRQARPQSSSSSSPDFIGSAQTKQPFNVFEAMMEELKRPSEDNPSMSPESRRRRLLQQAKQQIVGGFYTDRGTVTQGMRGEVLQALEVELTQEPLELFSWTEILERGMAIRERVFAPYFQREQEEREKEEAKKRENLEKAIHDQQRSDQLKIRKALWLEMAGAHIAAGCQRRGLSAGAKMNLELVIEQRIEMGLTGEEPEEEAEAKIKFLITQHFHGLDEQRSARLTQKRQKLTDEIVDAAIELAPVGLAMATPLFTKGVNWMMDKLNNLSSSTPHAPSQEHQEQPEKPDPTHHPFNQEASASPPSNEDSLAEHSRGQPAFQERLDPPEGHPKE